MLNRIEDDLAFQSSSLLSLRRFRWSYIFYSTNNQE